jgi:HEAT repeat protein
VNRREVAEAGHTGDEALARAALTDDSAVVRSTAIGALERLARLDDADVMAGLADPDADVRRRAAEAAAPRRSLAPALAERLTDPDWQVVEMACWAFGEHEAASPTVLAALVALATGHPEGLVREAAVAALGAIGDPAGLPAILAATTDKATVRRRAAIALAPFDESEAEAALRRLLTDRDWQTRQIAEDLLDER